MITLVSIEIIIIITIIMIVVTIIITLLIVIIAVLLAVILAIILIVKMAILLIVICLRLAACLPATQAVRTPGCLAASSRCLLIILYHSIVHYIISLSIYIYI